MKKWIEKIEKILSDNGIQFETSNDYINILNSSSMTRIHIFEYQCGTVGKFVAVEV